MRKLLTLTTLFVLLSCQSESRNAQNPLKTGELITPSGETIETTLAVTPTEQEQGLSGIQPEDFSQSQGMLFFNLSDDERNFWMPDTYFDLDIFYLDESLKILDIVRKLPHYKGRANPQLIPRARGVWCRHVLEMKASSKISSGLKIGDTLKWKGEQNLQDLEKSLKSKQ